MKLIKQAGLMLAAISLCLSTPSSLRAQNSTDDMELKEGKIWSVEYIRTKPGMADTYKKYLAKNYVKIMDKAQSEGLIADYMILEGMPANDADWDIMILVGVNKYADLDGMSEKFNKLVGSMYDPNDETRKGELQSRFEMRSFIGGKMARQLEMK